MMRFVTLTDRSFEPDSRRFLCTFKHLIQSEWRGRDSEGFIPWLRSLMQLDIAWVDDARVLAARVVSGIDSSIYSPHLGELI